MVLLLAGCTTTTPTTPTQTELIPFPAAHVQQLQDPELQVVQAGMPPPRISPQQAHQTALKEFNEVLTGNGLPPQSGDPLGLVRRVYVERPGRGGAAPGPPRTAWIVLYRSNLGFDCLTGDGGPGPCEMTELIVIDDQTGERLTSKGVTFGP